MAYLKRSAAAAVLLMAPSLGLAAPSITAVSGNMSAGEIITVTGADFGSDGPDVRIFDDFNDGTPGAAIPLENRGVGSWSYVDSANEPAYDATGKAYLALDEGEEYTLVAQFDPVQEFFFSYKVRIPENHKFPSASTTGALPDKAVSAWKLAWIMDGDSGGNYGEDDICLPSWPDIRFRLAGNDNGIGERLTVGDGKDDRWFSFSGWNRFSVYMKGGLPDPLTDDGYQYAQGLSEEFGMHEYANYTTLFDGADAATDNPDDNGISQWTHLKISPWARDGDRASFDDIYLAVGDNAAARVEIGNAPVYEACTSVALSVPLSWSDSHITASLQVGEFSSGDTLYLFIVDADNTPSQGYQITLDGDASPQTTGSSILLYQPWLHGDRE